MLWLPKQFGLHILLERPILLATSQYFPDPWDGSTKAARRMFRRVCGYMNVDPDNVELQFGNEKRHDPFSGGICPPSDAFVPHPSPLDQVAAAMPGGAVA